MPSDQMRLHYDYIESLRLSYALSQKRAHAQIDRHLHQECMFALLIARFYTLRRSHTLANASPCFTYGHATLTRNPNDLSLARSQAYPRSVSVLMVTSRLNPA
jgi:hypothetical protein